MPSFEVFTGRNRTIATQPIVSVQTRGALSLNKMAYEALGEPQTVELLFDRKAQIIGLRSVAPDSYHAYPVRRQKTSDSYLIAARAFLNNYGIPFDRMRRYAANTYGDVLGVDLKQGEMKPARKEAAS